MICPPSLINNVISELSQSWGHCRSKHGFWPIFTELPRTWLVSSELCQLIFIEGKQHAPENGLLFVFLIVFPAVNMCLSIPQTFRCWLKFQTLSLPVVPLTSWQHSYNHRVLIVLCDGNDCASLELCRFSHSLWACLFLGFVLKAICRLGEKKETKRGLLGAHNRSIITALIDRLI